MDEVRDDLVTITLTPEAMALVAIACGNMAARYAHDVMWAKVNCLSTQIILTAEHNKATLENVADIIRKLVPEEEINARSGSIRNEPPACYDRAGKRRRAEVCDEQLPHIEYVG